MAPTRDVAALVELARLFSQTAPRHRAHAQPEARCLRPHRGAVRPCARRRQHGARPLRAARRRVGPGARSCTASNASRRSARRPSSCRTSRTYRCCAGLGIPDRKLHLLGNGIDLERFDPRSAARRVAYRFAPRAGVVADDAIVCGVVGRLVWEKGYREVIEAARVVARAGAAAAVRRRRTARRSQGRGPLGRRHRRRRKSVGNIHFVGERVRRRGVLRGVRSLRARVVPRGFPALRDGSGGDGSSGRGDRHPRLSTGRRRRPHRSARPRLTTCPRWLRPCSSSRPTPTGASAMARRRARRRRVTDFDQHRCIDVTLATYEALLGRSASGAAA